MKLYDVTYYFLDEGVLVPERTWVVQIAEEEEDKILELCSNLSNKISGGIFMAQLVEPLAYDDSFEDFLIEELKNL